MDLRQRLSDLRLVQFDQSMTQAAVEGAASLGVRGADAFYLAVAERLRCPLATLDRDPVQCTAPRVAGLYLGAD